MPKSKKGPFYDGDFFKSVKEIMDLYNLDQKEVALELSFDPTYFSKVVNGHKSISRDISFKIKNFSNFRKKTNSSQQQAIGNDELMKALISLPGRMDQLTKQIADLQESMGVVKDRLDTSEEIIKKNLPPPSPGQDKTGTENQ